MKNTVYYLSYSLFSVITSILLLNFSHFSCRTCLAIYPIALASTRIVMADITSTHQLTYRDVTSTLALGSTLPLIFIRYLKKEDKWPIRFLTLVSVSFLNIQRNRPKCRGQQTTSHLMLFLCVKMGNGAS